ncbi:GAF domain-containing sensor histidine kinase [Rugamonas sp.]|uniref:GAF domain-containing sensor histidine kinase n=1 Tax=Rugamonas sp. TaxID=1926287 RepID=UPI0025FEC9BD|nr:GAF domain-containing sensor histidine kinase [Rugamonas sp.]
MSSRKHIIPDSFLESWQNIVDVMAAIFNVPAGLIMRVHEEEIEVLVTSRADDNPYIAGHRAKLNTGLYCETVMASRAVLQVPNALTSRQWKDNPDVELDMIAYVGVPLVWPDDEVFGTICVLDNKTRVFQDKYIELMWELKNRIESDFKLLDQHRYLEDSNRRLLAAQQRQAADAVELGEANRQLSAALAALTQMQSELLQSAKNAALGTLVAGVSHELSTPIGNSLMAAGAIQHQVGEFALKAGTGMTRSEMQGFIGGIRDGADMLVHNLDRAATLVSNFKKIASNDGPMALCSFNLRDTVDTIIAAALFRPTPHRVVNAIPEGIVITAYLAPFSDVLTELIENALRHAFAGVASGSGTVTVSGRVSGEAMVYVGVHDNGCGIASEHIERLFDPFFTTTLGQGSSGLGLHTVYNQVHKALGGKIQVDSTLGAGSGFSLAFPLPQPPARP